MDIELSVKDVSSVMESLQKYISPEILTGENQWEFKPGVKVDALKGLKIKSLPPILTLQLKR